jgi:serine protease
VTQSHRRKAASTSLLAVAIALSFAAPFASAKDRRPQTEFDQFIVRFKDSAPEHGNAAARQRLLQAVGQAQGLRISELRRAGGGEDVIRSDRKLSRAQVKKLIGRLRANPHVLYAEIDLPVYPAMTPNDPLYNGNQWHYYEATAGINAPAAWDITTGAGEVVAVLDTGITSHSDLNANVIGGYDFITALTTANDGDARDASPADPGDWVTLDECPGGNSASNSSWHGTHVAGTIAAVTNNNVGVAGIAHSGKVVPLRVLGKCGGTSSDINDAIRWAAGLTISGVPANANPAKVINLSLGGPGSCLASTQLAIDAAVAAGATVVIAAGNDNDDSAGYQPGNCNNIITVGAMDRTGARASYSNYGTKIDITAPGGGGGQPVASTLNTGTTVPVAENYVGYNGTSMATPHVAGVAALVNDVASPGLTPAAMESLLKVTSRTQPVPCTLGCGVGMLDAHAAVVAGTTAVLNITDPVDVDEGNAGTHLQTFTVNLSRTVASDVSFLAFTTNGTASAGTDYTALVSASHTIPAGQLSKTFNVTVNSDATPEDDETFFLNIDSVTGPVTVIDSVGTAQIVNDDAAILTPNVPVTALSDAVTGHDKRYQMTVPANATDLNFAITGGTGDADLYVKFGTPPTEADFDCAPFSGGNEESCPVATQAGTWHVMIDAYEAYTGVTLTGSYTVPSANMTINDVSIGEGPSGTKTMNFTVTLSQAAPGAVTFDIATANDTATAGSDYTASTLVGQSIPAGTLTKNFAVTTAGDTAIEANETFFVNLSNASGATITDSQGVGTILNDDGVYVSIADVAITEGNAGTKVATFVVALNKTSPSPVTYNIATANGSATAGSDYVANSLTGQSIPAGQLSKVFSVTINGDTTLEPNETFKVNLGNVAGATVFDGQSIGTILNDEGPTLSIADRGYFEGNAGTFDMNFVVTLSQVSAVPVTFDIATSNFTALNPSDYSGRSLTGQVIPAGVLTKNFKVTTKGDATVEFNEEFLVTLSNTSVSATDGQAKGTLVNDDGPILSINDATVSEGNSGTKIMTFTVSLTQASASPVTYSIATANQTASSATDYVAASAVGETIAAGLLSKTFSVTIKGDTTVEANETFKVNLSNASVSMSDGQGIGTITNDD